MSQPAEFADNRWQCGGYDRRVEGSQKHHEQKPAEDDEYVVV
jgi:hypothetical protein